ncbi:zinc finger and BTB domain-containing protein 8B [Agrilus planipennis]|uniref:Zinc finger and BTB domain-containing protein 8B n=1 Tax=Agrilus planipennis TaxID=224129 RepID=A0A1W4X1T8_AGRPL|nr:zinc finger and BTB domain-containing protein 8B [Agrilus planipennis]
MYSLYRAWLSMSPGCSMPNVQSDLHLEPSNTSGSPDVNLLVGPSLTHFSAHKRILSFNSGFFKAALTNHTGYEPITVPNVNVDEFSSLLTFMYTGFLDLNLTNIYNILLATHILHMPGAMELCRNFLIHNQQIETRTNIIKPVPSRKAIMPLQAIVHPPLFGCLRQSRDTSFKNLKNELSSITSTNDFAVTRTRTEVDSNDNNNDNPLQHAKSSSVRDMKQNEDHTIPTRSAKTNGSCSKTKKKTEASSTHHHLNSKPLQHIEDASSGKEKKCSSKNKKRPGNFVSTDDKFEIDVACCDGPVRFHRVLNKNYGQIQTDSTNNPPKHHQHMLVSTKNEAINRIMNENIREQNKDDAGEDRSNFSGDVFKCVYCNHTFKSQYCYQKHARRHLNPVLESKVVHKKEQVSTSKREVKLLDLNVQYYPCKMCGSKFPSYYFVHKHRKLCHSNENVTDDDVTTTTTTINDAEQQKSDSKENESKDDNCEKKSDNEENK